MTSKCTFIVTKIYTQDDITRIKIGNLAKYRYPKRQVLIIPISRYLGNDSAIWSRKFMTDKHRAVPD